MRCSHLLCAWARTSCACASITNSLSICKLLLLYRYDVWL